MRILIVGDVHEPVSHPGYLSFCQDLHRKYKCDHVVFIGDVTDWHAISFHSKHPEAAGPTDEYQLAKEKIATWHTAFPHADVCIGNHDERIIRVAEEAGIPSMFLRNYADVWETPGWTWVPQIVHDGAFFFHGTGSGGIHPAYTSTTKRLMSVVQGHIHSAAGIKWRASPERRIFGLDTGCGIDDKAIQFAYGKNNASRSILSAGVLLDGIPFHEIMPIGEGEKYHRSRFGKKALHDKKLGRKALERLRKTIAAHAESLDG